MAVFRRDNSVVLHLVAQDLSADVPGIESRPEVCGGDPCVAKTRIPVWLLEQSRRLGMSEQEFLYAYPSLRAEDLASAWAYVRSHLVEIESQIHANESA